MKNISKNNLMNKWMTAVGALLIALTVSLAPAAANNKQKKSDKPIMKPAGTMQRPPNPQPDPVVKVTLKCEQSSSDVSAQVLVTNNTGQTIPKGTKLYAKNQKGLSGYAPVSDGDGMQPNESVKFTLGGHWTDTSPCTAYYIKK